MRLSWYNCGPLEGGRSGVLSPGPEPAAPCSTALCHWADWPKNESTCAWVPPHEPPIPHRPLAVLWFGFFIGLSQNSGQNSVAGACLSEPPPPSCPPQGVRPLR